MLRHLQVSDFAIIDNLEVQFSPGMTVITGETGAGKSIAIDALSLALGERADSTSVREGAARAQVIAEFTIDTMPEAQAWLKDKELDMDGECVLRRTIAKEGNSRAYINGSPMPLQVVRELAEMLVDIYSQNQHQSLLKKDEQVRLLDSYAGLENEIGQLRLLANRHSTLAREIDTLRSQEEQRGQRLSYLEYQLEELNDLALKPGEWSELEATHLRLANQEKIVSTISEGITILEEDERSVISTLNYLRNRLETVSEFDSELKAVEELIDGATIQLEEGMRSLRSRMDDSDSDASQLAEIEQRMSVISDVSRKHHVEPELLAGLAESFASELEQLQDASTNIDRLIKEKDQVFVEYGKVSAIVSAQRFAAAEELSSTITEWLPKLGIQGGKFSVQLSPVASGTVRSLGQEQIEFLVSTNAGSSFAPLAKIASGGELSRISLAIQVVTAQVGRIPTLVFDEVDVGIGGATAEIVGSLLRTLGSERQVICITHQAQVAAKGNHHYKVTKSIVKNLTRTAMESLNLPQREEEIARMVGGVNVTKTTLDHAKEMLEKGQVKEES
ncbi:MAG: DNA repair protein RecN [Gammaproteobacteria bacterium]|nr:DNA repair protein RecN [Gammaproteobacteria bacterium]